MQKFNLTFLKKILLFAFMIFLVLFSLIFSSTIAFQKHFIQNKIINYKNILLESQIIRREFEINKDTIKITQILKKLKTINKNINDNTFNNDKKLNYKLNYKINNDFYIKILKYENLLLQLKRYFVQKGLDENSGLQGKFRNSIHDLEFNISNQNNKELLILILQIRRNEKDFLLRKNPKYINQVKELVNIVKSKLVKNKNKNKHLEINLLIINKYLNDFILLTEVLKEIDNLNEKIVLLENSINIQIQNEVIEKNKEVDLYLKIQNTIFLFSIVFIIYISYRLAISISKPINSLKVATNKISQGNYSYRAEIISNDEIGKFAALFNLMVDKLQAAYKKIEIDKLELENKIEERTNYLIKTIQELKAITLELEKTKQDLLTKNFEIIDNLEKEQELNQLKSKFIQTVSHEYRTPLTVIQNSTYLIEQYNRIGNTEKLILQNKRINESVQTMKLFLDNLFTMNKLDYGKIKVKFEEYDILDFVNSYLLEYKSDVKIDVQFNILNGKITTDITILSLILNNIFDNSNKFKSKNPTIKLIISEFKDLFRIEIIDNGIGIPEQEIKIIYEAFYRASNAVSIQGMGIGLTITKKYIELLKSYIFIESELNKGTKVIIELPKS